MAIEISTAAPAKRGQRLAPILAAVGVALAAFIWLSHINPGFPVTDDGIRDQLLMRDCADLGHCHLIGAPTSVPGIFQGAAWIDLLVAVRLLGGDTPTARAVVLALLALSVATLFLVVWRWLRASIALPAAVLMAAALSLDSYPSQLINPSASAFPDILTAAGLLCYGLSGKRRFLLLSAFALGVGINVHVGSVSLVPPLVAIAALGRSRPWRAVIVSVAVLATSYFLTSRAALLANIIGLAGRGWLRPALAGGLIVVLLSAWLGSRFRRLTWDARAWVIGFILVLPFVCASLWLVFWQKHHFGITYLHPILGPAAALAATMVALPFEIGAKWRGAVRWIPSAAVLAGLAFATFHIERTGPRQAQQEGYWMFQEARTARESWTLGEAKAIAERATQHGWSYENLVFHLQSSACRELLVGMSVAAPPPSAAPAHDRRQLQVMSATPDDVLALAGPHDVVPLGETRVAVLREIESWLDPEALVACRQPIGSDRPPVCSAADQRAAEALAPEHFLFLTRSFPEIHGLDMPPPYIATYEIPLSPVVGETRDLIVADHAAEGCQGWRITRIDGVEVEGQLPATYVRLHSESGGAGVLVMEKSFGTTTCTSAVEARYPPCVFELWPDDPLRALAEAG